MYYVHKRLEFKDEENRNYVIVQAIEIKNYRSASLVTPGFKKFMLVDLLLYFTTFTGYTIPFSRVGTFDN